MIITCTLNPCIDQWLYIASLAHGGINRVADARKYAAGKGINVSIALGNLGVDSLCVGFNYTQNGHLLTDWLARHRIPHDFVNLDGEIRTNIKLCETDTHTMTEINRPGAFAPPQAVQTLYKKIAALHAEPDDLLILSGSCPQGVDAGFYQQLSRLWRGKVIVDTSGEALKQCVAATDGRPYLIKPNLYELESTFGVQLSTHEAIIDFCQGLDLPLVCVSMGADGALLVTKDQSFFLPALDLRVRGVAGAGDAMVAGLIYGLLHHAPPKQMLAMAVAAAGATVVREGTQMCTREGFEALLG